MLRPLFLLSLLSLLGCHHKFKKYASTVGNAKVQVVLVGGPYAELGHVYTDNDTLLEVAVSTAINVAQEVRAEPIADRISRSVRVDQVNAALSDGLIQTLGSGPPFGTAPDAGALLQLEVESYGLMVPYLGAPGEFTFTTLATVYLPNGDRIYRHRMTCDTGVGDPNALAAVFSVVNNVKELDKMTDEQINQTFVEVARWCGSNFAVTMRRHAG